MHICVCVCVQTCMHLCVSVSMYQCLCTCVCMCVHMSVYLCMCMSGVPNIKFVSLACMPDEPKSAKCKNGICISVWCAIYKHSILAMFAKSAK